MAFYMWQVGKIFYLVRSTVEVEERAHPLLKIIPFRYLMSDHRKQEKPTVAVLPVASFHLQVPSCVGGTHLNLLLLVKEPVTHNSPGWSLKLRKGHSEVILKR